jgi:beta-galactosidase
VYRVFPDSTIRVRNTIAVGTQVPELARVGLRFVLLEGFENLLWFGRGPHESYCDRKSGAAVCRHRGTVDQQYFPYVLPQETGNHTDVRWFALDNNDAGILFVGGPLVEFSALHYTAHDLYRARHTNELTRRAETFVHIDVRQRGLGGASCGPGTLKKYRLEAGKYRLRYTLRPFIIGKDDPAILARTVA